MKSYRAVVVTGGGFGIGRAAARMLAADGWHVAIVDADGTRAGETVDLIGSDGNSAAAFTADVTDSKAAVSIVDEIAKSAGPVTGLVTCAAMRHAGPITAITAEQWDQTVDSISPPAPTPRRCFDIGRAIARHFADSPWRVALIASSSWSHGSLTAKHQRLYPDIDADRARLAELESGQFSDWRDLRTADLENSGQQELLNWVCLAGALTELGQKPVSLELVQSYIFNSSKCFAVFE